MKSDKFFKIIYGLFVGLFVLFSAFLLLTVFEIPGLPKIFIVSSGSMEPAIKTGALVTVSEKDDYGKGDIITFRKTSNRNEIPTTHRITEVKKEPRGVEKYTTKGDANEDEDIQEVSKKNVLGKVIFSVPYLGYIFDFAKKPIGFIIIIGLPALVIVGDEIRKILEEIRKIKKNKS